jgi:hypothetical protein
VSCTTRTISIGVYGYDCEPCEIIVRAIGRDGAIGSSDNFNLIIDPALTRRNAYACQVRASGGRVDARRLNNTIELTEWNTTGQARTCVVPEGWVEPQMGSTKDPCLSLRSLS